jgi:YD repeat-containing protein
MERSTYTYNGNLLASKTDAKNQKLTYGYDAYNRMTSVTWYNAPGGSQLLRTYYYDTNALYTTGFSQNILGRLAAVQYPAQGTIQMNDRRQWNY